MCFDVAKSKPSADSSNRHEVAHDEGLVEDAQRGTSFSFDWDQDASRITGIVEANLGNGWLQTIEVIPSV